MAYTPAILQSIVGLTSNVGLTNSKSLNLCSTYSSSSPVSYAKQSMDAAFSSNLSANLKTTVYQIGSSIAPFLSGGIPSAYLGTLTSSYHLPTILAAQSNSVFANGSVAGFIQNFSRAAGSTTMTKDLVTAANISMNSSFNSYGGTKFSDSGTFGFSALAAGTSETLSSLGTQLKKLGDSFSFTDMTKLSDPISLIKSIYKKDIQQLGGLDSKIREVIDPDTLIADGFQSNSILEKKLTTILESINDPDILSQYKVSLGVDTSVSITTLADLASPNSLIKTMVPGFSGTALPNLVANASGISSFSQLGKMMEGMTDIPTLNNLDLSDSPFSSADLTYLRSLLPIYDDTQGPKVTDLIGVVSGYTCEEFTNISVVINNYSSTSDGVNIISNYVLLTNIIVTWDEISDLTSSIGNIKSNIESAMTNIVTFNDPLIANSSSSYSNIAASLSNQITSLARANINLAQVGNSQQSVISFASSLGEFGKDRKNIGYDDILLGMCDSTKYGEAIKLSILEGKNLQAIQPFGENPPNIFRI